MKFIWNIWKKIAHFIGRVNTFIILSLFYFIILAPVAITKKIFRLFRKKSAQKSYWIEKERPIAEPERAKYQF